MILRPYHYSDRFAILAEDPDVMILSTCVAKCLGPSEGRRTSVGLNVSYVGRVRGF